MPAKRKTTEGSTSPDAAPPDAAPPDAASPDATSGADASAADPSGAAPQADGEDPVPLNRAERRARGKGRAPLPHTGRGKVAGGHGPAHTQRNWANRRSGG